MIVLSLFMFFLLVPRLAVLLGFQFNFKKVPALTNDRLPSVSVLIPARNEAHNLPQCLDSLLAMDYPVEQLEVIVGNDQSTDGTATVASQYCSRHHHIKLVDVLADYHGLAARANVLAQLAQSSHGDLLVFLDADMEVRKGWLKTMVAPVATGYNLVSGYTEVRAINWFSGFQQIDWLNMIMLLKAGADLNLPGTALGNNMLVSRKAYDAIGGYEKIGPTFTEDNDLTLALRKKGYRIFQIVTQEKAITLPIVSFRELFKQRNRWMQGAFKQPLMRLLPLIFSRVFVLWGLVFCFWEIRWGIGLMLIMAFSEMVLSLTMAQKTRTLIRPHIALIAPVFNSVLDTFTLLSYPCNQKVVWKGRKL